MKFLERLEKSAGCWFLIAISTVFFFLRFPSLYEPDWYGDEGIYQTLGIAMNSGRLLYKGIFDNKPPLLYYLYSLVSSDLFMIRALSLLFGLFAVFAFFFIARRLLSNNRAVFIATTLFALLFGLPLLEGNIANSENFMLLPNIIAGILVLKVFDKNQQRQNLLLIASGLILGISALLKIVAIFDFAAFALFITFMNLPNSFLQIFKKETILSTFKKLIYFSIGFFIPILLVTSFFIVNNAFSFYIKAVLFNNVGYVGYGNKLIIPQGLLIFKLLLLSLFSLFVFIKRNQFGKEFSFIGLWFAFSLFDAFFSQRPYTHYVLVVLPSFCLMLGLLYLNKNFAKVSGVLLLSAFILILLSFRFYIKTAFYYQNFLSFITGNKSVHSYQKFFDSNTPRDYDLASFLDLNTSTTENIFIWGNNAQVYKLTDKLPPGRYTVAYHMTNYPDGVENTREGLQKSKPKYIILMPGQPHFPFSLSSYYLKMNLEGVNIYERFGS